MDLGALPAVEIDRDRVADMGLDISVIGRTLETLLGGRDVTTFKIGTEQYDVTVALPATGAALLAGGLVAVLLGQPGIRAAAGR